MYVQSIRSNGTQAATLAALTQPESLPCDRCAGRSLGVCGPLCNKSLATLVAMGGQRRWAKRQTLYCGDDLAPAFYKITKGIVAEIMDVAEDGRRQIVAIRMVGDLCGYPTRNGRYLFTGLAITPVEACAFAAEKFSGHMERNLEFAGAVAGDLSERLKQAAVRLSVVGRLRSMERVAHFILEMEKRLRSSGTDTAPVELHLTREEIGDYLGLRLETVSRAFRELKDMRLIALVGADVVAILDRKRLSEIVSGRS
jgi:CRP-like cAMP-binding protein